MWRQFGAVNPDLNYIFWSPTDANTPVFSINMARNTDPAMETALLQGRQSPSKSHQVAAYQQVSKLLAKDLPYVWYDRTTWAIAAQPKVQNFANPTAPARRQGLRADRGSDLAHPDLAQLLITATAVPPTGGVVVS